MQLGSGVKDKLIEKSTRVLGPLLYEGETFLAIIKGGSRFGTEVMAVTSFRTIELDGWNKVNAAILHTDFDPKRITINPGGTTLKTGMANGEELKWRFSALHNPNADCDMFLGLLEGILQAFQSEAAGVVVLDQHSPDSMADEILPVNIWGNTKFVGGVPGKKALEAITRMAHSSDERPWFVLRSWGSGLIAAFDDRLILIKTGAFTSLMAGSFGGERATTFYYPDINAIEFNSGLASGVLEILTASYSGGANKDFWRGTTKSRNADSNDPYTLSNTLPTTKSEYAEALPQVNELRRRISESKRTSVTIVQSAPEPILATGGLASQIRELKELHDAGALSAEEFNAAKAKLLS